MGARSDRDREVAWDLGETGIGRSHGTSERLLPTAESRGHPSQRVLVGVDPMLDREGLKPLALSLRIARSFEH